MTDFVIDSTDAPTLLSITGQNVSSSAPLVLDAWSAAYAISVAMASNGNAQAFTFQGTGSQTYSPPSGFTAW